MRQWSADRYERYPVTIQCYESVGFHRLLKEETESYECLGETWNCIEMEIYRDLTIESGRLVLRRWKTDDAEALYKYASDKHVSELALWPRHTSMEMSREVIEKIFMPNPDCFAIVLKQSNEAIGCIGLVPSGAEHHTVASNEREVGYWIGSAFWGRGLTTEALEVLVEYCRNTLRLESLLITTDARNIASQRVAEKCGFLYVESYEYDGIRSNAYKHTLKAHTPSFLE